MHLMYDNFMCDNYKTFLLHSDTQSHSIFMQSHFFYYIIFYKRTQIFFPDLLFDTRYLFPVYNANLLG